MRSLNKKFTESKIHNKESDKLRDYEESGVFPKQKSKSKYLYQKEENDEDILNEDQLNTFIGRHRSYKDEDITDQSRWNLAIRDRLKKRSMKVRQILLSSRDSIDKLDQSNSDSQKHKSKESFDEFIRNQKFENINAPHVEQKKESSQFKAENKGKFSKDIKPERMRRVTTPIESKLLSNEEAKRSTIDDIMNRHKYLNPHVYIKSNLGESESKELSSIEGYKHEESIFPGKIAENLDHANVHRSVRESSKNENFEIDEHDNSQNKQTRIASLRYDPELGLLGKVISHNRASKRKETSRYRETRDMIKKKRTSIDIEMDSLHSESQQKPSISDLEGIKISTKYNKYLNKKELYTDEVHLSELHHPDVKMSSLESEHARDSQDYEIGKLKRSIDKKQLECFKEEQKMQKYISGDERKTKNKDITSKSDQHKNIQSNMSNQGEVDSEKLSEKREEFISNKHNYDTHRPSSSQDFHEKSQDQDSNVHQRSFKTNLNKFQRPKRSQNSEAIELKDFEDSSDDEEKKYLQDYQYINEEKNAIKKQTAENLEESNEHITKPFNREEYEERQIKSKSNTSSKILEENINLEKEEKEQFETSNKILDQNINQIDKISSSNKINPKSEEIKSEYIDTNLIENISFMKTENITNLKTKMEDDSEKLHKDIMKSKEDSESLDLNIIKDKYKNIERTEVRDDHLVNPIIKNVRERVSHDFDEIDENDKDQSSELQTPKNEEFKKSSPNLETMIKQSQKKTEHFSEEIKDNIDDRFEEAHKMPIKEQSKIENKDEKLKDILRKYSDVEEEKKIMDPLYFEREQENWKFDQKDDREVKSSKSTTNLNVKYTFEDSLNQKMHQSYIMEGERASNIPIDYYIRSKLDKDQRNELDITDIYKLKSNQEFESTDPIHDIQKQHDPSKMDVIIENKEEDKEEQNKLKIQMEVNFHKDDENILYDENQHETPSQSKESKSIFINASQRDSKDIKNSKSAIEAIAKTEISDVEKELPKGSENIHKQADIKFSDNFEDSNLKLLINKESEQISSKIKQDEENIQKKIVKEIVQSNEEISTEEIHLHPSSKNIKEDIKMEDKAIQSIISEKKPEALSEEKIDRVYEHHEVNDKIKDSINKIEFKEEQKEPEMHSKQLQSEQSENRENDEPKRCQFYTDSYQEQEGNRIMFSKSDKNLKKDEDTISISYTHEGLKNKEEITSLNQNNISDEDIENNKVILTEKVKDSVNENLEEITSNQNKLINPNSDILVNKRKSNDEENDKEESKIMKQIKRREENEIQDFNCDLTFNQKRNTQQTIQDQNKEINRKYQKEESMFDQEINDREEDFTNQQIYNDKEFNPFGEPTNLKINNEREEQKDNMKINFSTDNNKINRNVDIGEATGKFGENPGIMYMGRLTNPKFADQLDTDEELPRDYKMERHKWTAAEWNLMARRRRITEGNEHENFHDPSIDNQFYTKGPEYDHSMNDNLFDAKESKIYSQDLSMEYYNKGISNDFYGEKRFSTDSDPNYNIFSRAIDKNMDRLDPKYNQFRAEHKNGACKVSKSKIEGKPNKKLAFSELKPSNYKAFEDESQHDLTHQLQYQNDETISTLGLDYTLLDPNEPLIIDSGVMKFHPGFSINYVSRWVHVTKSVIRFYKNYYHSVCSFRRPLAVIPIGAVGSVKTVKESAGPLKSGKITQRGKNPFDQNQFEIELKEDYEAIYDLNKRKREIEELRYELELIQKLDEQTHLRNKYKKYRKQCRLSKSPVPTFKIFADKHTSSKKSSRSNPRLATYSRLYEDEMSRIDIKTNRSHEMFDMISRGRQSRLEVSGDRSVISIDEQYVHKSASRSKSKKKRSIKTDKKKVSRKRCKTPFDSTLIVDGHLMPIRVNTNKANGKSTLRNNTKTKHEKKNVCQWSKRETDWFKFERRFILATKTKSEKKKWMSVIKKLIPKTTIA